MNKIPEVEGIVEEEKNKPKWYNYDRFTLSQLEDGETWTGRPLLMPVETVQWEPEDDPRYRCRLVLVDDDHEAYVQVNLNLKTPEDVQENVHRMSLLYSLIAGVKDFETPAWSKEYSRLKKVDLYDWRVFFSTAQAMTIVAKEIEGKDFSYMGFQVLSIK